MKGEFKGDFSRDTFDPSKHFLRVLMQQGRVSLDADWNEQVDILLHYMQALAEDIIGPFAGPADNVGFEIKDISNAEYDFKIGTGRYYVDGILCENEKAGKSCNSVVDAHGYGYYGGEKNGQPNYPISQREFSLQYANLPLLVYLDVWERHISSAEDDYIREKALGGPDTASRSKVVWQVKVLENSDENPGEKAWMDIVGNLDAQGDSLRIRMRQKWPGIEEEILQPFHRGCLKAQANKATDDTDPCITSPDARYRGEENQLYRVEIHREGDALQKDGTGKYVNESAAASFKWSRDNGTVAFPIVSNDGLVVFLEHLGRDDRLSLKVDDWVEIIDDDYTLLVLSRPSPSPKVIRPLAQVDTIDLTERKVTLRDNPKLNIPQYTKDSTNHPLLRRWDHKEGDLVEKDEPKLANDGALFVEESKWLNLEDGVQVYFNPGASYYTGDYWQIPARTAIGDVEWPKDADGLPIALPPRGVDHHHAPLAVLVDWTCDPLDCRCTIKRSTTCYDPSAKKSRTVKGGEK
ncbi:MAG: hypothetical protein HGA93_01010 [Methanothrix sp.]|nr:hypothetical protein [Methanothrix sp.]